MKVSTVPYVILNGCGWYYISVKFQILGVAFWISLVNQLIEAGDAFIKNLEFTSSTRALAQLSGENFVE